MEHMCRLPNVPDHVDDVQDHRDVHAEFGGARFHEVELRLGPVDERHPNEPTKAAPLPPLASTVT